MMDRLDRSYHDGHMQLDLNGDLIGGPKQGEKASDYFKKHLRDGRIFVGFDCDDDGLNTAVTKGGRQSFLFGSDFPHEVFDAAKCRHEIDELLRARRSHAGGQRSGIRRQRDEILSPRAVTDDRSAVRCDSEPGIESLGRTCGTDGKFAV